MKMLFLPGFFLIVAVFVKTSRGQECSVSNLPIRRIAIDEDIPTGVPIAEATRPAVGVTSVTVLYPNGTENKFFTADLNADNSAIEIFPTEALADYFMNGCEGCDYTPPTVEVHYKVQCGSVVGQTYLMFNFDVLDKNNKAPEFKETDISYTLTNPVKGAPINWKNPIEVFDKDFLPENNNLVFSVLDSTYVKLNADRIESTSSLDHYNVYIILTEDFNGQSLDFTLSASDGKNPATTVPVHISIEQLNPYIKTEGYNPPPLENKVNEEVTIARIGDGTDPNSEQFLLKAYTDSKSEYFEVAVKPIDDKEAEVTLKLIKEFLPQDVENNVVRLNVIAKYDDPEIKAEASVPVVIVVAGPKSITIPSFNKVELTGEENSGDILVTIDPSEPEEEFEFLPEDPLPDYIELDNSRGIITLGNSDEITPGVDVFTVKVTRRSDGGESKTVVIIHRNPTTPETTTATPAECTTVAQTSTETTECPTSTTCDCSTSTPIECPASTPFECPTSTPIDCPTSTPIDCPTSTPIDCPTSTPIDCPTSTPVECTCPTGPPEACPTTQAPIDGTTSEQCDCSTCPTDSPATSEPCESTGPTSEPPVCPTSPEPPECPVTCDPCVCTGPTSEPPDCPVTSDPPESPSTSEPCVCTGPTSTPPECPATSTPPECPVTSTPPECPVTSTPPECPVTSEQCDCTGPTSKPPECPATSEPPECPTSAPCDCSTSTKTPPECPPVPPVDDDCSTAGLVAGVAVLAAVSVISGVAAVYLWYTYIYKAGQAIIPSGTEFVPRTIDPEMGVGKNSVNGNQFGDFGNGKGTSNSANFGNGDYRVNGSIGTSSVPSLHRTSIPKSGFEPFGAIGASPAIVAPVPLSPLASGFSEGPAAPKSVIPTGAPEYSYVSNASDIGTGKSQDTASVVESLYAQPASETGRRSSIKDKSIQDAAVPKVEPVPVVEPKVDYNRITFADDLVKIIQIDDTPEAEGTDDVSENNEGEEDDENTEDSL